MLLDSTPMCLAHGQPPRSASTFLVIRLTVDKAEPRDLFHFELFAAEQSYCYDK